ncbi:estrogen-related receptor gamma isoform X2 [Betta splendens]|uniref:Estrogen-related receptor gamma isoform X2 n=1 Tax=Betta splendens TaxID=158456 RepID=A0A6P7P9C0_BETSP|nr:estrogen-related receptor gamma isoform X2 [Betta splendens]
MDNVDFLSPQHSCFPGVSPSHPAVLLPSPASSSSSDSLTGSGGGGAVTETSVQFSLPRTNLFSAQVEPLAQTQTQTRRLCLVCGDLSSGFHYGVASCEACKAFFKRTVQGNIEYSCPAANGCEITKRRRKACQACRFQKCLQAGMMREGVRVDRVRGGRQKYRRQMESGLSFSTRTSYSESPPYELLRSLDSGSSSPAASLLGNKVISQLLLTEPAPPAASGDHSSSDGSLQTLLTLCDLFNRELLVLIGWAKQIPGFSGLSLLDQMSLLQSGWMEALLVGVAWRSQGAPGQELVFAGSLRLNEGQCQDAGLGDLYDALHHLTAKYQAMKLSREEVVVMKAMALANSDADPVDCPDSVQRFQDELHEALVEYEASRREQHRVGRLLMSLPLLRQSARTAVQAFLRLHQRRRVPLHKLLLEMLDAKPEPSAASAAGWS